MDDGKIEVDSITPIGFPDMTPELARESAAGLIRACREASSNLQLPSECLRSLDTQYSVLM
jgi:hypothetical protein